PDYAQQTNFLDPWPGGWWRLRDIIEYEKAATYSMLTAVATFKEKFKQNFYRLNREAIAKGKEGSPFAYLVRPEQHDPNNAIEMLKRLRFANVDIYQAEKDFSTEKGLFEKGTFIIPLAQPTRAYIKDFLEIQQYPNLQEYPGGPPRQPYDVTAWTLGLQFDAAVVEIETPFKVDMKKVEPKLKLPDSKIEPGFIAIERRFNHSFKLVNDLLGAGFEVHSLEAKWDDLPPGTFIVNIDKEQKKLIKEKGVTYHVPIRSLGSSDSHQMKKITKARIGIYQPWIPGVYDEGWMRLILDNFGFEYSILHNADFKNKTKLKTQHDVLIFGSQGASWIVDGKSKNAKEPDVGEPKVRSKYTGGIGKDGVDKIKQFLQEGGTVLFFGEACNFAIEKLQLPATNTLSEVKRKDYFAPGSLFEFHLDLTSPLTYGMQKNVAIYKNRPVALKLKRYNQQITETGFFGDRNILQSGWAVGEDRLYNKVGLAEIPVGKGRAILYAFRPQHRGQTFGTFKLIFNALYK
ncbi:hypothetical protein IH879_01840, partial [candidate division KSB1 bacterium]|nr:hypothetical protein [candidate division KSB1 bacterium]